MTAVIPGAYGTARYTALLHTPAKTCHWQLFAVYGGRRTGDVGRETKDGGNRNWQFTIWKQRLSAGEQAAPLSQQRPI